MLLFELAHATLRLGVVQAESVRFQPSTEGLLALVDTAVARVRSDPSVFPERVRSAIRDVLRVGGYKPTGRGKPASELLLALAQKEGLPRIGNLVEINNLVSLESALPISIFDARKLGDALAIRFGVAGESYVFNHAGHSMELEGLPVVCRGPEREPVGNAVRDSMKGKVDQTTQSIVSVVYGSTELPASTLREATERLSALLRDHAGATGVSATLVP